MTKIKVKYEVNYFHQQALITTASTMFVVPVDVAEDMLNDCRFIPHTKGESSLPIPKYMSLRKSKVAPKEGSWYKVAIDRAMGVC